MIVSDPFLAQLLRETGIEAGATRLPESFVARVLSRHYGLRGELKRINTEKDDTFLLDAARGRLLVKVASAAEAREAVDLQTAAMLHVAARAPELPVQRLVRAGDGEVQIDVVDAAGRQRIVRVFSFIDGLLLHQVTANPRQLRSTGALLARLDQALADFTHPYESRLLLWDMTHFSKLRSLIGYVERPEDRELAHRVFDDFEERVEARLPALETQVIHGDYSPFNIVVDPALPEFVKGVIDFGDVVRGPVLFELSVAVANQLGADTADPWGFGCEILRGYHDACPLEQEVVEMIAYTAPARLLLRALIYGWRSVRDPQSREYAISHSASDWQRLRRALTVDQAAVRAMLADVGPRVRDEERIR